MSACSKKRQRQKARQRGETLRREALVVASVNDWVRERMREQAAYRRIQPPLPIDDISELTFYREITAPALTREETDNEKNMAKSSMEGMRKPGL